MRRGVACGLAHRLLADAAVLLILTGCNALNPLGYPTPVPQTPIAVAPTAYSPSQRRPSLRARPRPPAGATAAPRGKASGSSDSSSSVA